MTVPIENAYDWAPYPGLPLNETHPDQLAVIARLHGLASADVTSCRVLELGCATGGNLLPMALTLPSSHFVGIDLSQRQIAAARQQAAELSIANIRFGARDLLELDDAIGTFDYIICHGVFSWVATDVQEKILEICGRNLAPEGIAYVSYNTYPGWHLREIARRILLYHAESIADCRARLGSGRQFLELLARIPAAANPIYRELLAAEAERVARCDQAYVFHEYMDPENNPVYFRDFVRRAERHGLTHVSDVEIDSIDCERLPPELHQALEGIASGRIDFEQRADFARGRAFRRSVLCRAGLDPLHPPAAEALREMFVASPVRPADADPHAPLRADALFRMPDGASITTNDPPLEAALLHLARNWPRPTPFGALCDATGSTLPRADDESPRAGAPLGPHLAAALLRCFSRGFVELHTNVPEFATRAGERPLASPYARLQLRRGLRRVTNLLHRTVELHQLHHLLLMLLDGSRDRGAILEELLQAAQDGRLSVQEEGAPVTEPARARELLAPTIEPTLSQLAAAALLVR